MKLYHFPNAELKAKFNTDQITTAVVDPEQSRRNYFSRNEFRVWDLPRSFWYVDQCSNVETFFMGRKTVLLNDRLQHSDAFRFCKENFEKFEGKTGCSLDNMTTQDYFDALKAYCEENSYVGFKYNSDGRLIFVTWLPLIAELVNVEQQNGI